MHYQQPLRLGALITADFAADHGRDVLVVPGSVLAANSAGCHRLLRDGARPVTSAADVLADLGLADRGDLVAVQRVLPIDDEERRVLAHLSGLLATMELKGSVRNAGAQHYARV